MEQLYATYDAQGAPTSAQTNYYFSGPAWEMDFNVNTITAKVYYLFAGQTIAMRNGPPGTPLEYFLTDQLGSVILALDASGNPIAGTQQRYMPFGQPRFNNTPVTDFAYTGQRDLDLQGNLSLGLMDYNARFYDSRIMEFQQPDTLVSEPYNPQTLNRYAYAQDNPIRYNDPSGHCIDACIIEIGVPLFLIAAAVVVVAYYTNPGVRQSIDQMGQYLADQTEADRQANAHKWQQERIDGWAGKTGDSSDLPPGSGFGKWCYKNFRLCIGSIITAVGLFSTVAYCSADGENCSNTANQNQTKTLPTPTPNFNTAPSGVNYCPLGKQCLVPAPSNSTINPLPIPSYNPLSPPIITRPGSPVIAIPV